MNGSSQEDLTPHHSRGDICSLTAAQGMAGILEMPLLMGTEMGNSRTGEGRPWLENLG